MAFLGGGPGELICLNPGIEAFPVPPRVRRFRFWAWRLTVTVDWRL